MTRIHIVPGMGVDDRVSMAMFRPAFPNHTLVLASWHKPSKFQILTDMLDTRTLEQLVDRTKDKLKNATKIVSYSLGSLVVEKALSEMQSRNRIHTMLAPALGGSDFARPIDRILYRDRNPLAKLLSRRQVLDSYCPQVTRYILQGRLDGVVRFITDGIPNAKLYTGMIDHHSLMFGNRLAMKALYTSHTSKHTYTKETLLRDSILNNGKNIP